jgi:cytidylate kinase
LSSAIPVVTVDGPSGTGKGTLCAWLAGLLGWHLLDSGALYRLVALRARDLGLALDDESPVADVAAHLPVAFEVVAGEFRPLLDGQDVSDRIRTEDAGTDASLVAALPAVRDALLTRQRDFREAPGLIADGRDMGTVIFPDATLKLFLTASPAVRAERRYKQLSDKGMGVNLSALLEDIRRRDQRDQQRATAPLQPAADAIILDTTSLGIAEVEDRVRQLLRQQGLA